MPFLPDASPAELAIIVALAAFSAVTGGVAGYGTGALMPLILVPMVGAAPVVPIIAISAMFTNSARVLAFRRLLDLRRAVIAAICALPTCVLGAWLYTLLSGRGAALVIGTSLIATVPLRRLLKRRGHRLGEKGFAVASAGWGVVVGGSTGAGVILLSLLMASGLEGAAVIATDAAISIAMGVIKISVFGAAGVLTPKVLVIALLISAVAFPCTFLAKLIVERMPIHVHTALLDAVVIVGGAVMISSTLRP
ncbi:MAG TPA: sulfite exporter TauE/SafE family protein [Xanthobacteraceae bacterium]|nr:sulfite exporter TauE/SafE family protein [Xanthobacteraceae bacterium]